MGDTVNMSLDEIIKQNQAKRGGGSIRGRGGGRGGRRGRGGRGGNRRGRSQSRSRTPNGQQRSRSRSRSRGPQTRGRSQSRGRPQPKNNMFNRSRSQQRRRSNSRARSRSQRRSLTPKGRAGLENLSEMPQLVRSNRSNRGGFSMRLRRSNSMSRLQGGGVHSRLGLINKRGNMNINYKPFAVAKRGIAKRGGGLSTRNRYSNVGLRSDQIMQEQRQNNVIRSQTFTRSRNNSFNGLASQLTVSVANDFVKRRRNSAGNTNYLNKQSLAQLNNEYGGYRKRGGPGSARSVGSNRSNKTNRSNSSRRSTQTRGRGRGRGNNRGVGRNFVNKQILNPKLQQEIAAIQGKNLGNNSTEPPPGVNVTLMPATTKQPLHQRFALSSP
ncbi:unnamed protein product [Leptosia nina]|uniref:Uncharacterized protein n=1 Tax=Leptosia nina TaxID=320188 RepID=A0AAV1JI94_9NEOP